MNYGKDEKTIKIRVSENPESFFEKEYTQDKEIIIGRSERCDLVLRSKGVSREHCRIYFHQGHWQVEDLKSQNGVRLNDRKITLENLKNTDVLKISDYRLEVSLEGDPATDTVAPGPDETLLYTEDAVDDQTVMSDTPAASYHISEKKSSQIVTYLKEHKIVTICGVAIIFLFLLVLMNLGSDEKDQVPEQAVLTQEVEKSETMMDMESQHRISFYIQSGKEQYQSGNYNEALIRFETVISIDPKHSVALEYIDRIKKKLREIEAQQKVVDEKEAKKMARVNLIVSQARQAFNRNQFSDAQDILAEAVFLVPNDPGIQQFQSEIEEALARDKIRQEQLRQEKENSREQFEVYFNKGQKAYGKKDYYNALLAWEQALQLDIEGAKTNHINKNMPKIRSLLKQRVSNDYKKGKRYYMNSNFSGAITYLKRVILVDPDYRDAGEVMQRCVKRQESRVKELYQEGLVYEGIGQRAKAEQKWRLVLQLMPLETNGYYQKASKKLQ